MQINDKCWSQNVNDWQQPVMLGMVDVDDDDELVVKLWLENEVPTPFTPFLNRKDLIPSRLGNAGVTVTWDCDDITLYDH
ncbi:hypothetical protein KQX54_000465 [Cotesia glomerata]|uniref:DUF2442 domain-containing protein n=1 Tax=Cotesia glomerata TaxID=32391 RepID=A0AAV7IUT0_COTGL|nr:hypothetical protein KQX54_000465 [Cotesia glomerata]